MATPLTDEQALHVRARMHEHIAYLHRLEQALLARGHVPSRHPYLPHLQYALWTSRRLDHMSLCAGHGCGFQASDGTANRTFGGVDYAGLGDGEGISSGQPGPRHRASASAARYRRRAFGSYYFPRPRHRSRVPSFSRKCRASCLPPGRRGPE